ncbi:MAG TPA: hypothetical protein PJ988_13450, partial [Anaerolinea sp.]|nr:hypothetical protein [Anaerolinea sp.]
GVNIYRTDLSSPPYTVSNYPPIFMLFMAPWLAAFGPNFWAGRLISSLSAWICAGLCGLIVHRFTSDRLAGWFSAGLFLAIPYVTQWSSLARIDMLALAFSLGGMYLVVKNPVGQARFILGALLLVAAVFTRQTFLLAAPLAVFVWLLFSDWRQALRLVLWVGGGVLLLGLLLQVLTRGGFFLNIVGANVNQFGLPRLRDAGMRIWHDLPVLIILAAGSLLLFLIKMDGWKITAPYLLGGFLSALTIGKIGSNVNYLLEFCAGLCLGCGLVVHWVKTCQPPRFLRVAIAAGLVWQVVLLIQVSANNYLAEVLYRRNSTGELRQLADLVAATSGDIPADEYMGIGVLQGRRVYIQPFEMTQLARAGLWDEQAFVKDVAARKFPLILIHYFPGFDVYKERWTPAMLAAVGSAYEVRRVLADTHVFSPKANRAP